VNQGIVTGADKVSKRHIEKYAIKANVGDGIFVLSDEEVKRLNLTEKEKEILKPWFKNSDIYRWSTNIHTKEKLIFADKRLHNLSGNKLQDYLMRFKKILDDSTFNSPYLHRPRDIDFINEKIVAPQRSPRNTFGYNEIHWYASADVYFITEKKDKSVSLKYILALLNSKLYYLWLYHRGKRKGETLELYQKPLSEIPIKKISESEQQPFITLVDQILSKKQSNHDADTSDLEKQIDELVYQLYGLTDEEIKIIEKGVER
jgi:adenine-specific DNA-methyltransferase